MQKSRGGENQIIEITLLAINFSVLDYRNLLVYRPFSEQQLA